jgi:hypothetical protein
MQVEHKTVVNAPAEVLFAIYQDVQSWSTWDPDTKHAFIDGPFIVGSRGRLTPTKGNTVPMILTEVQQDHCFTVESKIPMFRMLFEHILTPVAGGTEVVHRVSFFGPLSPLLGRILIRQLNVGLPITLSKLKSLAEANARTPTRPDPSVEAGPTV